VPPLLACDSGEGSPKRQFESPVSSDCSPIQREGTQKEKALRIFSTRQQPAAFWQYKKSGTLPTFPCCASEARKGLSRTHQEGNLQAGDLGEGRADHDDRRSRQQEVALEGRSARARSFHACLVWLHPFPARWIPGSLFFRHRPVDDLPKTLRADAIKAGSRSAGKRGKQQPRPLQAIHFLTFRTPARIRRRLSPLFFRAF